MKHLLTIITCIFCIYSGGFSQPHALLLQQKAPAEWDTVCVFHQNDLIITQTDELVFQHSSCLPVASSNPSILYFVFPNNTYFLINTNTVLSSIYGHYPYFFVYQDSIRSESYKIELQHLKESLSWKTFVKKWSGENSDAYGNEKTFMEIGPSYIVLEGDTMNQYDNFHQKDGKWIVYDINNVFRKDSTVFYLPFDVSILAEQHFDHGKKTGTWTVYYRNSVNKSFLCTFVNDSLVKGIFYKEDGKIRYKYLYMEDDSFVVKDYTDKRKKMRVSMEEMMAWLRL